MLDLEILKECKDIIYTNDLNNSVLTKTECLIFNSLHIYGNLKKILDIYSDYVEKFIVIPNFYLYQYIGECILKCDDINKIINQTRFSVYEVTTGLQFALDDFLNSEQGRKWKVHKVKETIILHKNILSTINSNMSSITLPITLGDAYDKLSILKLKLQTINKDKSSFINEQYTYISNIIDTYNLDPEIKYRVNIEYKFLNFYNKIIWDINEKLFNEESTNELLTKQVFSFTKIRNRLKQKINKLASTQGNYTTYPELNAIIYFPTDLKCMELFIGIFYWHTTQYDGVSIVAEDIVLKEYPNLKYYTSSLPDDTPNTEILDYSDLKYEIIDSLPIPEYIFETPCFWDITDATTMTYVFVGPPENLIFVLYVIYINHKEKNKKGNLYIGEDITAYGGKPFLAPLEDIYKSTKDLIESQPYINKYMIATESTEIPTEYINLSTWKFVLDKMDIVKSLSTSFSVTFLPNHSWLHKETPDLLYKDYVIIYTNGDYNLFPYEHIINENNCIFICDSIEQYNAFPYKHLLPVKLCNTIEEITHIISSCKLFIGNQTILLSIAYALNKPTLAFLTKDIGQYSQTTANSNFYWITFNGKASYNIEQIKQYIKFYKQYDVSDEVKLIRSFFPRDYHGIFIDIGPGDGCNENLTYNFELDGWNGIGLEPIEEQFNKCKKIRDLVINCLIDKTDGEKVFVLRNTTTNTEQELTIKTYNFDKIIKYTTSASTLIDFITISFEGDILEKIDLDKYQVKLFVIKNISNNTTYESYLSKYSYTKLYKTNNYSFYVRKDLFPNNEIVDTLYFIQKHINCEVYQYGMRAAKILDVKPCKIETDEEIYSYISKHFPTKIIINWNDDAMKLETQIVLDTINIKKILLNHGINETLFNNTVNVLINNLEDDIDGKYFVVPRPIFENVPNNYVDDGILRIGSFGYNNTMNFPLLCKLVNGQFDKAIITLLIPGVINNNFMQICNKAITKPGIKLIFDNEIKTDEQILDILSKQTINLFVCGIMEEGNLSGSTDYGISVNRPMGVSLACMFNHAYLPDISVDLEKIQDIINRGTKYVEQFRNENRNAKFIEKFNQLYLK